VLYQLSYQTNWDFQAFLATTQLMLKTARIMYTLFQFAVQMDKFDVLYLHSYTDMYIDIALACAEICHRSLLA